MKYIATVLMLAGGLLWTSCGKPDNKYDNNRAEAAETEGQKDKDNMETNEEAEADSAGLNGSQSAQGANAEGRQKGDQQFAMQAAEAGLAEVKLAKLAETQASSKEVKAFAAMMLKDHTAANNELKNLAQSKGVTIPADCKDCEQKVTELRALKGEAFDKKYSEMMVADHKDAVSKFTTESTMGQDADLKKWATEKLPTLKHHLSSAETLNKGKGTR
jgi:putative membrane protein